MGLKESGEGVTDVVTIVELLTLVMFLLPQKNGTNFGYGNGTVKSRQFRLPPLFFKIAIETPDHEKMMADWNKRFPYINTSKLSMADTIVITYSEAEKAAAVFATSNVRRRSIEDNLFHYYLGDAAIPGAVLELVFPKSETSHTLSFLSAFIIKVVYEAFKFVQPQNKVVALTLMSLNAQHIALQMLRTTREWSGDPKTEYNFTSKDPSLLDMWEEASHQVIYQSFDRAPPNITRVGIIPKC
ncbi:unnamed protein product [Angiostrongylus costaricensis]|uniref:Glycylpeptide N-tetradecanoyltransferase n=1 Tax=Angiostrongylus costaricensis TaxID=334426 RepID=A0A0R3Q0V9_ANGCS|nr:unnamed protein product [Angiostrongylus costaricensis]